MSVVDSTRFRSFVDDLARSQSGQLLNHELGQRWPDTTDQLSAIVRYALLPAGKLLRPIMTLQCAEAVGGDVRRLLPAALGMEYLHVATLVHDDIIDADEFRRGRPAVPVAYGLSNAILAGDHLIFSAFASIVEGDVGASAAHVVAAVGVLAEAGKDLCRGQVVEADMARDLEAGVAAYHRMVSLKTGALFRAVCHIGALLGGADAALASRFARYGVHVGVAFQIRDDLLAYAAPERANGKPATSDLSNGRPTLPLLLAYESGTRAQRRLLMDILSRGHAGIDELTQVGDVLRATGAMERARAQMAAHAESAHAELVGLTASPSVDVLAGIAHWSMSGGLEDGR